MENNRETNEPLLRTSYLDTPRGAEIAIGERLLVQHEFKQQRSPELDARLEAVVAASAAGALCPCATGSGAGYTQRGGSAKSGGACGQLCHRRKGVRDADQHHTRIAKQKSIERSQR